MLNMINTLPKLVAMQLAPPQFASELAQFYYKTVFFSVLLEYCKTYIVTERSKLSSNS